MAAWLNLLLGNSIHPVTEIALEDGKITKIDDCSSRYEEILEDVIRRNERMCGFTSVRARYLFDKGEQLEALADEKEANNPDICANNELEGVCAFCTEDHICYKPSRAWKKQYEKLMKEGNNDTK